MKHIDLFVPRDMEVAARTARRQLPPYDVPQLIWDDFTKLDRPYLQSIRPANKQGDPIVHDIRALEYDPSGEVLYQTHYSDEWEPLPQRVDNLTR